MRARQQIAAPSVEQNHAKEAAEALQALVLAKPAQSLSSPHRLWGGGPALNPEALQKPPE